MFHDIVNHVNAVMFVCRAYLPEALMCVLSICLLVHLFLLGKKQVDALRSMTKEAITVNALKGGTSDMKH